MSKTLGFTPYKFANSLQLGWIWFFFVKYIILVEALLFMATLALSPISFGISDEYKTHFVWRPLALWFYTMLPPLYHLLAYLPGSGQGTFSR